MKFRAKVYWEMSGEVEVEADSPEEAAQKAIDGPLPQSSEYVSDSCNCDAETDVAQVEPISPQVFDNAAQAGFDAQLAHIKEVERIAFQTQPGSCPP